ncbi:hypothetical protein AB1L30_05030 [Bremerella sp. JC817]|uniref:hypothetical protein n=1 Tax=Bremerella sp. JC817 TaxID=3231756 RepID=UPI00345764E9
MDEHERVGPRLEEGTSHSSRQVLYGFSDSDAYERFRSHSTNDYRPYPLVKGYLREQLQSDSERIGLIVLDAVSARDEQLNAAAMDNVLQALEASDAKVGSRYRLTYDAATLAYQVSEREK